MERRGIDMWLDPWLLDAMFFERMADAQRAAERRRLLRLAEPERGPRAWSALVHRLMHVAFRRWVRHQIKRIIRTGSLSTPRTPGGRASGRLAAPPAI